MTVQETASDAVVRMLRTHVDTLRASEGPLRRDDHDSVHQTRIAVRRLRSLLKEYRGVIDRKAANRLRRQLKVWGDELGVVRDAEVRASRGEAMLAELSRRSAERLRPVLVTPALDAYRTGHEGLLRTLDSDDHASLLHDVERYAHAPPFGPLAALPARHVLDDMLAASARRVAARAPSRRQMRGIRRTPDRALESLHALRKRARRVRHAGEAAVNARVFAVRAHERAEKLAEAAEAVQDALGDHRDASLYAQYVEALIAEADDRRAVRRVARRSRKAAARAVEDLRRILRRLARSAAALERA